jgi:hypothetical protein
MLHDQRDTAEEEERQFFSDLTYAASAQAVGSHNHVFLNTFYNIMKDVLRGGSPELRGPTYFNRPPLEEVSSAAAGTSHQPQQPKVQKTNFAATSAVPGSTAKISSVHQKLYRDIDPNLYNQKGQEGNQQPEPSGFHYSADYNTWNMLPNPGYQGTQNYNPQCNR